MNVLSIVGTGAAWLNYRKAKREYEAVKEKHDALVAAVNTYNETKYNEYDASAPETKVQGFPDGILVSSVLRVGNLVGKMFRAQASIVLSNTSDVPYYIGKVMAGCYIFDQVVTLYKLNLSEQKGEELKQEVVVDKVIAPGETISVDMPKGITALTPEGMDELRATICAANGKKLITSCPKTNIETGCETADIKVDWDPASSGVYGNNTGYVLKKPGVLRYVGEAFL